MAQALTKKVIERGYTPFVVIRPENDASRNLYTKLGFEKAFSTVRVTLVPNNSKKIEANGHDIVDGDVQNDEGIEDMRSSDIPQRINGNTDDSIKDEGIDDEETKDD